MKHRLLCFLMLLSLLPFTTWAQSFVNLTPRPKTMTVKSGVLPLPSQFTISYTSLDELSINEVNKFANDYQYATGNSVIVAADDANALVQVSLLPSSNTLKEGGYKINVTTTGVSVQAKSALGFYYAFQSIKKMLPANVMAGVKDAKITSLSLPRVSITDEPRFAYRGFMLDVSRHFFTIEEVKRMIDVMSYYKLNAFHWHLSDDQGWRVEIKKYPKLTSVASMAPNSRFTDMDERTQYWINKPYGPYFYTQEQIKDVVAYAKARHIEVIPEIDMPGHFCAALAAYPEFSCTPQETHTVQIDGGIYPDVMNVANPNAVQFTKDILSELIDMFPSEYIHIGGDECPVSAWKNNKECQEMYAKLGLTDYRQLQSHFIKEMADFVKSKGRKLAVWNEAITASGADLKLMKATGATVFCWTGPEAAVTKANKLGLPSIYTPWGPYYINRKQGSSELDPPGAGDGTDNVQKTYETNPPAATSYGVQGTFWTEHVSDAKYMEWLALPRLLAIAENGWTPQARKDFSDFQKRMTADTTLLNYGNYRYCKYKMLGQSTNPPTEINYPFANTPDKKYYYRIISGGTDATRKGRCIELLAEGSSLISQNSSKGAKVGVIWTNTQASEGDANYDNQWWSIEEDPNNKGHFALVCKAQPNGSLKPNPSATSTAGRWSYDNSKKYYNFQLGTGAYGTKGSNYYYSIESDKVSGQYLNSSMSGQGLAVNLYGKPNDGAGGQWEFSPLEDYGQNTGTVVTFDYLKEGKTYTFSNAVDGFEATAIADKANASNLIHSTADDAANAWIVEEATVNADGSQSLKLKNATTGRYIATAGSYVSQKGYPVSLDKSTSATITLSYVPAYKDLRVKIDGKSLFPLPSGEVYAGPTINGASYDAARGQGSEWTAQEVKVTTFKCVDDKGNNLGTIRKSVPASVAEITAKECPTFKNTQFVSIESVGENVYKVTYKRVAYAIVYHCTDDKGAIIDDVETACNVGEQYTVSLPTPKYYELKKADATNGDVLTPTADVTINVEFTTDALTGVKKVGAIVTKIESGKSYLIYDATTASGRSGYRLVEDNMNVNRAISNVDLKPNAVWTLTGSGKKFKVENEYLSVYIPALQRSQPTTASKTSGESFTFNLNSDGETWNIKGSNGMYWDGAENGNLVGWNGGTGHPIRISTFYAQPYYTVKITCVDDDENVLDKSTTLVKAGDVYTLLLPLYSGYVLTATTGNEDFNNIVEGYLDITAKYTKITEGVNTVISDDNNANQSIYDLQGRRLQHIGQQGIYIVNGKKIIVK